MPAPIHSFQDLISGVISPKISAITQKFGSLSSGILGSSSGSASGGSSASGGHSDGGDENGGSAAGGLSGIISAVLRLSGPLIASVLGGGGASSGGLLGGGTDSTTEADDFDSDFK